MQAEDRLHRWGQSRNVTVWWMLAEGTIDVWMTELLEEKRSIIEKALNEGNEDLATQERGKSVAAQVMQRFMSGGSN
jgi:SNF2 family DNA or RNA helicase